MKRFRLVRMFMESQRQSVHRQVHWLLVLILLANLFSSAHAQNGEGSFQKYQGDHILIVTDLPPTPQIADLTKAFDAAFEQWASLFGADTEIIKDWKATAFIMMDRSRFESAGLFSPTIREFREGHQEGDLIFCKEQPSDYYRRHLLLHEGVHWFMEKHLGGWGPGWWMEGIAEWQATHRWDGTILHSGVMPATRDELPYWGRIKWLQEDLDSGRSPSLPKLFRQAKDLHRFDSTYAWSWTAVVFFANHPRYSERFYQRLRQPTDNSDALTRDVLSWIGKDLQLVQGEFNLFVTDLDYGVDLRSIVVNIEGQASAALELEQTVAPKMEIAPRREWQTYPQSLSQGIYAIQAEGRVSFDFESYRHLRSEPQGITLRYVKGKPIAQLQGVVIPKSNSLEATQRVSTLSIGRTKSISIPESSYLLLRPNFGAVPVGNLSGAYTVTVVREQSP